MNENNIREIEKALSWISQARRNNTPLDLQITQGGTLREPIKGRFSPEILPKLRNTMNKARNDHIQGYIQIEKALQEAKEEQKKGMVGLTRRVLAGPRVNYRLWRAKHSAKKRSKK